MSEPLDILIVCRSFPAHRAGGMEFHAQDVLDGLMARGHRVHVLTTPLPRRGGLKALEPNGTLSFVSHGEPSRYTARSFALLARDAARICARERIDVVHAQGFAGIPLGLWGSGLPPVVTTVHGTLWSETPLDRRIRHARSLGETLRAAWRFRHRLAFEPVWRAWLACTPNVVVDSRFTMRELHRTNPRLRARIVPLGVDAERLAGAARAAVRSPLLGRVPEDCMVLLGFGRLEAIKGFDLLPGISAALTRDGAKNVVVIAGEGPEQARLRRLAHRTAGAHVLFLGRVADDDLPGLLASADVVLNPDRGWPAFGLANAEALCAGAPVIATPHGAHPEVVSGEEDGMLFEVRDPQRWARAARMLGERDRANPARRIERSRSACARFSREEMVSGLEQAYRAVLADGGRGSAGKRNSRT